MLAKDDVDNVGAGRAAKGVNPFVRSTRTHPLRVRFLRGADEGSTTRTRKVMYETESGDTYGGGF